MAARTWPADTLIPMVTVLATEIVEVTRTRRRSAPPTAGTRVEEAGEPAVPTTVLMVPLQVLATSSQVPLQASMTAGAALVALTL